MDYFYLRIKERLAVNNNVSHSCEHFHGYLHCAKRRRQAKGKPSKKAKFHESHFYVFNILPDFHRDFCA